MRLIDADALIKTNCSRCPDDEDECDKRLYRCDISMEDVFEAPTIDAVPVQHGHWDWYYTSKMELHNGYFEYTPEFSCSVCGHRYESYRRYDEPRGLEDADFPNYCENCGAKMDEVQDGTDL